MATLVSTISDGFGWAENLAFDGQGGMYVSDLHGSISKIMFDSNTGSYVKNLHISDFVKFLGLAPNLRIANRMYAAGIDSSGGYVIISFDIDTPQSFEAVAIWSDENACPNGLGVHNKTGLIYTSSEGNFLPGGGLVFVIDPASGSVTKLKEGLWASDGLYIDETRDLLYVGQVVDAKEVWVYDLGAQKELGFISGLPKGILDDFCLSHDGSLIFGADWTAGKIISFPAYMSPQSDAKEIVTGLNHITSVKWGTGPGFEGSLFSTEGTIESLYSRHRNDRVFKIDLTYSP